MPKNATQIIFECSEDFKDRIDQERLKRGSSRKKMIMEALEDYWRRSPKAQKRWLVTLGTRPQESADIEHWVGMWREYLKRCPPAKIQLLQRVMEEDLKAHKPQTLTKPSRPGYIPVTIRPFDGKEFEPKRGSPPAKGARKRKDTQRRNGSD